MKKLKSLILILLLVLVIACGNHPSLHQNVMVISKIECFCLENCIYYVDYDYVNGNMGMITFKDLPGAWAVGDTIFKSKMGVMK